MNFASSYTLTDSLTRRHVGSADSGEDGPTEQAILLPDGQTLIWHRKWEMECQVLTDGDSLSEAGPPIAAVEPDTPTETRALPESTQPSGKPSLQSRCLSDVLIICVPEVYHSTTVEDQTHALPESTQSSGKPVGSGGDSATAGSQPNVCDPQDLSTTAEDPSFIGYEEEEPTFPSLDEQTVHQENHEHPPTPTLQIPRVVPAVRVLEDAQLPPAKKKRTPREVEASSLDEVDNVTQYNGFPSGARASSSPTRYNIRSYGNICG
ncbi:hypothetical protein FRC00_009736 [Tulasnella sp. 408]|nr:hypothetical protein FRC00_009736 [Tulasnella sp. 408]